MKKDADMSDQSFQDYALTGSDIEELLKTVKGSLMIHIRTAERDGGVLREHSPMDFHLHALIMQDSENGTVSVLCLDTSDMVMGPGPLSTYRDLAISIGETFVEKINSILAHHAAHGAMPDRSALFVHADDAFWKMYSRIKEETFMDGLGPFASYLASREYRLTQEPVHEEPAEWKEALWAQIRTGEERLLGRGQKDILRS